MAEPHGARVPPASAGRARAGRRRGGAAAAALLAAQAALCCARGAAAAFSCAPGPGAAACGALSDLYDSLRGPRWPLSQGWAEAAAGAPVASPCAFYGVTCDAGGDVVALNLTYNELVGTLPDSVGDLSALRSLDLHGNFISGSLPAALGRLRALEALLVSSNSLTGRLPAALGGLKALTRLELDVNQLDGSGVAAALCAPACGADRAFRCGTPVDPACGCAAPRAACAPPCPAAGLSAASFAAGAPACLNATSACDTCLTALLLPMLASGIPATDTASLAACFKQHTADFVAAGAAPAALDELNRCPQTGGGASAIFAAAAANQECPVRLAVPEAFAPAVGACANAGDACGGCADALSAPLLAAGMPLEAAVVAACWLAHMPLILAAGVSGPTLAAVARCPTFGEYLQQVVQQQQQQQAQQQSPAALSPGAPAARPRCDPVLAGAVAASLSAVTALAAFLALRSRRAAAATAKQLHDDSAHADVEAALAVAPPKAQRSAALCTLPDIPAADVAIGARIGKGAKTTVYAAQWRGVAVAVKVFDVPTFGGLTAESAAVEASMRHELALMAALRHRNVCAVLGCAIVPPALGGAAHGRGAAAPAAAPALLLALAPRGSLEAVLRASDLATFTWAQRLGVAEGVACGVAFLHARSPPIIHRDLKSANVVLSADGTPLLIDFGLAHAASGAGGCVPQHRCGTSLYMAPECVLGAPREEHLCAVDVWGLGVIGHDLAHCGVPGGAPFVAGGLFGAAAAFAAAAASEAPRGEGWTNPQVLYARHAAGFAMPLAPGCPPPLAHLLAQCLAVAPHERPTSDHVRSQLQRLAADAHSWR